jgi:hypothetical protein
MTMKEISYKFYASLKDPLNYVIKYLHSLRTDLLHVAHFQRICTVWADLVRFLIAYLYRRLERSVLLIDQRQSDLMTYKNNLCYNRSNLPGQEETRS